MKDKIRQLNKNGFFSIYFSSILSKVVTLLGGILIVRMLNTEDYAIYVLVINAYSMLCFLGDFGSTSAMLQFTIENYDKQDKQALYFKYGLRICLISALISSIFIVFSKLYYPFSDDIVSNYTLMLFIIPFLTTLINYICIVLRAKEMNKKYSYYQFFTTLIHYLVVIILTYYFGLKGSLLSQYVYNFIVLIIGVLLINKVFKLKKSSNKLLKNEKRDFLKLSLGSQINNTISSFLYTIDIFALGLLMVDNIDISYYKVATIIPNALAFLPSCLMIYLIPSFVKNRNNKKWIVRNVKKLFIIGGICYGIISLVLIIISKPLISLLYGAEYVSSFNIFIILVINFFVISTFKIPISNLLYTMHKIKINLLINIIGITTNFILNIILIKEYGTIGAAYATLIVSIILSILNIFYLKKSVRSIEQ